MDLLGLFEAVGHAREALRLVREGPPPEWVTSEVAFQRHFGATLEEYQEIAARLDPGQTELLDRTLAVNPEAAILWVLSMEEMG